METVFQYLNQEKKYLKNNITAHGYCLGSGFATALAAAHPGVNLVIERCYSKASNVLAEVFLKRIFRSPENRVVSLIKRVAQPIISNLASILIIDYDNLSKIKKVSGKICIVDATFDDVMPSGDIAELRKEAQKHAKDVSNITFQGNHTGNWGDDALLAFSPYLKKAGLIRSYGISPPIPFLDVLSKNAKFKTKALLSASTATSKVLSKTSAS
jgi:hypothetical protein